MDKAKRIPRSTWNNIPTYVIVSRFGLLLLILLLAVSLRVYRIGSESFWLDETISIREAQVSIPDTVAAVEKDVHAPLYFMMLNVWVHTFGISEFTARGLSAIFGTISVLFMYLLGKGLFSKRIGLLGSLLLAVSPIEIFYSQEARMYSMMVCLTLVSMWLLVRFLQTNRRRYLIANGVVSTALLYTHIFGFLVILVHIVFLIISIKEKNRTRDWLMSEAVACALFLPWAPFVIRQAQDSMQLTWIPYPAPIVVVGAVAQYFGGIAASMILLTVIVLFLAKNRDGLASIMGEILSSTDHMLVVIWAMIPLLAVLLASNLFAPLFHVRYLLFTMPAYLLILIFFLSKLSPQHSRIFYSLIIVACISTALLTAIHTNKDDWRSVATYLRSRAGKEDIIFVEPYYEQESLLYYYGRECFTERYVYGCAYRMHNILSPNPGGNCCSQSTRLIGIDEMNTLADYVNRTGWLLSARSQRYENYSLFTYLNTTKTLTRADSIGEIRIYRFE